jgi:prevent-host-death family protein
MQATIPFSDLRARLAETLRALEQAGEPVFISRRGEPAAVLMSVAQYRRLTGQVDGPLARLEAWRARHLNAVEAVEEDTSDVWGHLRDRTPGRAVNWAEDGGDGDAC